MNPRPRPRIVVSKCIEHAPCRYDGAMVSDALVRALKGCATLVPVCPEMEIGLGCPRQPIRIVAWGGQTRLVQPATGLDVTQTMRGFCRDFLDAVGEVDGFILKSRSPSCGISDVKIFSGPEHKRAKTKGRGLFAAAVLEKFPDVAVEDEVRLGDPKVREHFLTRVFAQAALRRVCRRGTMGGLVAFHAANKWLLMGCDQAAARRMGRIVANHGRLPVGDVFEQYRRAFAQALRRPPRPASLVNVLTHAMGVVSDRLTQCERALFLDTIRKYRAGKVPLAAATTIVRSWAVRFDVPQLLVQTYLEPYPEAMVDLGDSGKGGNRSG